MILESPIVSRSQPFTSRKLDLAAKRLSECQHEIRLAKKTQAGVILELGRAALSLLTKSNRSGKKIHCATEKCARPAHFGDAAEIFCSKNVKKKLVRHKADLISGPVAKWRFLSQCVRWRTEIEWHCNSLKLSRRRTKRDSPIFLLDRTNSRFIKSKMRSLK
jgi:hypothetical protein